ncbi:MAG: nuclease [Alphaproteobacteria bacterium]|nr:nuclease [Alphaproteobacteria bacterium]
MSDPIEILWEARASVIPDLGTRSLVDVTDGDTPNIRMPIRMLSVDTPEVTARSEKRAKEIDQRFLKLAEWIEKGTAPVSNSFRSYILPKLRTGNAGTLQFKQGKAASNWFKLQARKRLKSAKGNRNRSLFIYTSDAPFDSFNRLLAYIAPSYSSKELSVMTAQEKESFNLDLVRSGWAVPFIIFPNIPGERELPLYVSLSVKAEEESFGQYAEPLFLPAYEYRMCEKLYTISARLEKGEKLKGKERRAWRSRYVADMRNRLLYDPEGYTEIPIHYRLWIWPNDLKEAIGMLNLKPSREIVSLPL